MSHLRNLLRNNIYQFFKKNYALEIPEFLNLENIPKEVSFLATTSPQNKKQSGSLKKNKKTVSLKRKSKNITPIEIKKFISISHSIHDDIHQGIWVISDLPIGIDIEVKQRIKDKLVFRVSNKDEIFKFSKNLKLLWGIKEACFKSLSFELQNKIKVISQVNVTKIIPQKIDKKLSPNLFFKMYYFEAQSLILNSPNTINLTFSGYVVDYEDLFMTVATF